MLKKDDFDTFDGAKGGAWAACWGGRRCAGRADARFLSCGKSRQGAQGHLVSPGTFWCGPGLGSQTGSTRAVSPGTRSCLWCGVFMMRGGRCAGRHPRPARLPAVKRQWAGPKSQQAEPCAPSMVDGWHRAPAHLWHAAGQCRPGRGPWRPGAHRPPTARIPGSPAARQL